MTALQHRRCPRAAVVEWVTKPFSKPKKGSEGYMPSLPFFVTSLVLLTLRHQADRKTQSYECGACRPGGLVPSSIPANGNGLRCVYISRKTYKAQTKPVRAGLARPGFTQTRLL